MDVGSIINDWLVGQDIPVRAFAKMIPCIRESAYRILRKRHIDTDLLLRISIVLQHDFFADCSKSIQIGHNVAEADTE